MIRRPPRSTLDRSSAASDVYKRQAFRKFRQKLGAAFGSGSGGGSGEDKALNRAIAGLIVLVLASLWLYAGINVLDAQERAVVLRFGRFHEVLEPGFNWNPKWVDQVLSLIHISEPTRPY